MIAISKRQQVLFVATSYAMLSLYAVYEWHLRHLAALQNPIDASGGMWAAGDEMLNLYLFCLFMVPTFFLLRLLAGNEAAFAIYAKIALAISLTAPLCAAPLAISLTKVPALQDWCVMRLWRSPMVLVVLAASRIAGRHHGQKKLLSSALAIEFLTLLAAAAILILVARTHH